MYLYLIARPDMFKNPVSSWQLYYDWFSGVAWKDTDVCVIHLKFQLNLQSL